ncbi:MAG: phage portal protein [Oscillospiraceae bacterium]|nr:phage portal protein [Oscillospiraceae bacterium]
MGLFDKLFRPQRERKRADEYFKTLTAYRPVFHDWRGELYESALVRAAIDARARHISKLKVETVGTAKPELQRLLKLGPNQFQTWGQFLYRVSTILDVNSTAFIVPIVDNDLKVTGYFPVLPERVEIIEFNGEPWLKYKFTHGQEAAIEMKYCAVLNRFQYRSDFFGTGNRALDETMDLISIQNQGIKEGAKNSATYRFMAKTTNFTTPDDLREERKRFSERNLSAEADGGGVLLFPNTYTDIKQLAGDTYSPDPKQMELIQTNVFDYFGVNEDVLQNKAYGDAWSAFYEGAIEVFAIQFSDAMTKAIFTENERSRGSELILTANRLQYLSNADKLNVTAQLTDRGIFSINEAREVFNLPPVEGGDVRTIRGEYKNAEEINGGTEDETGT